MIKYTILCFCCCLVIACLTTYAEASNPSLPPQATGKLLSNNVAMYPRVIVLSNSGTSNGIILADVTSFTPQAIGAIFASRDNGTTFTQVGAVQDPDAAGGLCCTTIFELPVQVGSMPAGTLIWAGSIGQGGGTNRRMSIKMWQSRDIGRTWTYVSSPAVAGNAGGLWEPEFSVDIDNQLVCHFSDETSQPKYSQLLQEVFSKDGVVWSQRYPTVASTNAALRPGMANVRKLTSSLWIMTYEVCASGNIYNCAAHYRTASNGQNWGDPTSIGNMITDSTGRYFAHAPTIAFSPKGTLVLAGQMLMDSNGKADSASGATLFTTTAALANWKAIASPVHVSDTKDDPCPNYSSALVFIQGGARLLEVATDYQGQTCLAYYASQNV